MRIRTASLAILLSLAARAGGATSVQPPPVPPYHARYASEIAEAQACLDTYMMAFNKRDLKAWEATFNFPYVRFASNKVTIIQPGQQTVDMFTTGSLARWDHSDWARRDVIHAGPDKVHINTRFNRYRKDGSLISAFDSIYIVTRLNGHWGCRAVPASRPDPEVARNGHDFKT